MNVNGAALEEGAGPAGVEGTSAGDEGGASTGEEGGEDEEESDDGWGDAAGLGPGAPG